MPRLTRRLLPCLAVLASLAVAGCGNKEEFVTVGETEGIYVTVDDLKYQVQISRILNPGEIEDQGYLRGVEEEPAADEVWFAVFMRVQNDKGQPRMAADSFEIIDTQENRFEPVEIDEAINVFSYVPRELPPGTLLPALNSAASDNTIRGGLLLFKVKTQSLYNRPLELEISSSAGEGEAVIDLDV